MPGLRDHSSEFPTSANDATNCRAPVLSACSAYHTRALAVAVSELFEARGIQLEPGKTYNCAYPPADRSASRK